MFQNLAHPRPEPGSEAFEDQMRIGLRDCAARAVGDIMAQDDIVQGERSRGPMGEVRYGQSGGCAAVFVEEDQV